MKFESRRLGRLGRLVCLRRRGTAFIAVAALVATASSPTREALADSPGLPAGPPEPEPWCRRDQDLACTLVRETSTGVWIWTERFRPAAPGSTGWTLAVGAGSAPPAPLAVTHLVATNLPSAPPTPNGAPILE
jgi:hypothetical protein